MRHLIPILIYLFLTISIALVIRPNDEEMQRINIAHSIRTDGKIACPIWDSSGLAYIDWSKHFYSLPPGADIMLAGWFSVFKETLFNLRLFSIFIGLIGILAWGCFYNAIGCNKNTVFFALVIVCSDFIYTRFSCGRPFDVSITALLGLALASYISVRDYSIYLAIAISQFFVALSGMIHPNGVLVFIETAFITLYFDRKRIKIRHLLPFLIPYIAVGIPFIYWITRDFTAFKTQFIGNTMQAGQWGFFNSIWSTARCGFGVAYGFTIDAPPIAKCLIVVLAIYIISTIKLCKQKN